MIATWSGWPARSGPSEAGAAWVIENYLVDLLDEPSDDPTRPVRARVRYGSAEWLVRFLLGSGGSIRVVDEPEVAAEVSRRAVAARAHYR